MDGRGGKGDFTKASAALDGLPEGEKVMVKVSHIDIQAKVLG